MVQQKARPFSVFLECIRVYTRVLSDCHTVKYSPKPPKFVHCHPLASPNFRGPRCSMMGDHRSNLIAGRNPDFAIGPVPMEVAPLSAHASHLSFRCIRSLETQVAISVGVAPPFLWFHYDLPKIAPIWHTWPTHVSA